MGTVKMDKSKPIPLDEALAISGVGLYTNYVLVVSGLVIFNSLLGLQVMGVILPVIGCELGLTSYEKGLLTSTPFFGMMLSSFVFGFLADSYGRRSVMLWCMFLTILLSIVASLSPNSEVLMVIWFFAGFLVGGSYTPAWVYASEFCATNVRARSVLVPAGISSLAQVYLPGLAWVVLPLEMATPLPGWGLVYTSWRLFLALLAVPFALSWYLLYRLPDSPKYILNRGEEAAALRVLSSMFKVNQGAKESDFPVKYLCLDEEDKGCEEKAEDSNLRASSFLRTLLSQVTELFTRPLLPYTVLSIALLLGCIGSYNTLYLWFPDQMNFLMQKYSAEPSYTATLCDVMSAGTSLGSESSSVCELNKNIFIISMIANFLQSLLFLVISFIADRVGQKRLTIIFSGLSCLSGIGLIYADAFLLTVTALSLTVISLSVIFPLSYSVILDYFPTSVRSTASSLTMLVGRLAVGAGSQTFGAMFQEHCVLAYWGMAALLISTLVMSIIMPTKRTL